MPEIKVECDCGQRFKFDVSPVNGQMPYVVNCPVCGADGTAKANAILASMPQAASILASAAPMLNRPVLRVSAADQVAPVATAPVAPAYAPAQSFPPQKAARQPNFALGVLGAVLGGLVGMFVWYFIFKTTGKTLGFLAIGVGILTGYSARLLGRYHGTNMGLIAALCAFLCIIGAQYMRTKVQLITSDDEITEMYDEEMVDAKALIAAIPNGTDDEIRLYLVKEAKEYGGNLKKEDIDAEEVEDFRTEDLVPAQDLVSGKKSKQIYAQEVRESDAELYDSPIGKIIFWVMALGIFNIVSICIGVGSAYKLGAGEE